MANRANPGRPQRDWWRDAISDLQDFCRNSRSTFGDRFQSLAGEIEDVTSTLEHLRSPLDTIRQHLN